MSDEYRVEECVDTRRRSAYRVVRVSDGVVVGKTFKREAAEMIKRMFDESERE